MSIFGDVGDTIERLTGTALQTGLSAYELQTQRDVGVAQATAQGMAATNAAAISAQTNAGQRKTVLYVGAAVIVAALFLRQTRGA